MYVASPSVHYLPAQGRTPGKMAQARGCNVPTPTCIHHGQAPIPIPHHLSCHPCRHGGLSRRDIVCHCVLCGVEQEEVETQ